MSGAQEEMANAIELTNITKTFIERTWKSTFFSKRRLGVEALKDATLAIGPGEVCGLLGPNGAGKTTLIKILATLILPDSGAGSICGHDLLKHTRRVRGSIGLVNTSERSFYWRLSGRQNLDFFATLQDVPGARRRKRIEELTALVGLNDKIDALFMHYSDGQKQRLALARALLSDPAVLLMDEPTKSIDPIGAKELIDLTKNELAGRCGKTILWSTHNLSEAERVCSRLCILHRGTVVAAGDASSLRSLIDAGRLHHLKINACDLGVLRTIGITPQNPVWHNGSLEFDIALPEKEITVLIQRLVQNKINIHECTRKEIGLEEVFEKIVRTHD